MMLVLKDNCVVLVLMYLVLTRVQFVVSTLVVMVKITTLKGLLQTVRSI
jgi:hypothetical protein